MFVCFQLSSQGGHGSNKIRPSGFTRNLIEEKRQLKKQHEVSKLLDKQIERERKNALRESVIKLLLLGTGDCGKTTIAKQMQVLYMRGFESTKSRNEYKPIIFQNVTYAMTQLIKEAKQKEYTFKEENEIAAESLNIAGHNLCFGFEDSLGVLGEDIGRLWDDQAIKNAYKNRNSFQLIDSAQYFFDNIKRLSMEQYIPSIQDILYCRASTTGITEIDFQVERTKFRLVDVGGQRVQRRKWWHCFEEVNSLIFVVGISDYDLVLSEDHTQNRMIESIQVFKNICGQKVFETMSIMVFLNKTDIFEEKIRQGIPLEYCFPDYSEGANVDAAKKYIYNKFSAIALKASSVKSRLVKLCFTTAIDTKNVEFVFDSVRADLMKKVLQNAGGMI